MSGSALPVLVAAAGAFGFFAWLLAKAAEVETAKIARPTIMIFFMRSSLENDAQQSTTDLG
jgi:type IV secretory pathway TrbD component